MWCVECMEIQCEEGREFCGKCNDSYRELKRDIARLSKELKDLQDEHVKRTGIRFRV